MRAAQVESNLFAAEGVVAGRRSQGVVRRCEDHDIGGA